MLKTYKPDWDGIGLKISAKNTITDGGSTATHSKTVSVWGGLDWILLRKLVLLEHLKLFASDASCCTI